MSNQSNLSLSALVDTPFKKVALVASFLPTSVCLRYPLGWEHWDLL